MVAYKENKGNTLTMIEDTVVLASSASTIGFNCKQSRTEWWKLIQGIRECNHGLVTVTISGHQF